jgi:fermentation-respiration switch protein FrsA (DUF1100 family)
LAVVASLATAALMGLPAPAGARAAPEQRPPYAVGLRWYTFVDKSRATPPNGTYPGEPSRTLRTLVIYPAEGDPAAPGVENAPPVEDEEGFPLLVFSHGSRGDATSRLAELTERLVRVGFVVAAPTFPLTSANAPGGPSPVDYVNQPGDVSFVLTEMLALVRRDQALAKTIDVHRIGAIGNSLGAVTTLGVTANSCCRDPRIDAAVSLWGAERPFPRGSFFSEPTPPLMLVHGTADARLAYAGSVAAYQRASSPKAFLTLKAAPHNPFFSPWQVPMLRSVIDFFEGFLNQNPQAIRQLPRDGNVPGVASLKADLSSSSPVRFIRRYYALLSKRRFLAAWEMLGSRARRQLGPFRAWKAGYRRILSVAVTSARARLSERSAVVSVRLRRRDRDACTGRVVRHYFRGRWTVAPRGESWLAVGVRMHKTGGGRVRLSKSDCEPKPPAA